MAITPHGAAGVLDEVDTTFRARRLTIRPGELLGWHSIGATSGLLVGVTGGASLFSLRNIGNTLLHVRRVGVGFRTTTAFTTPQVVDFGTAVARSFVTSDTGGTAIAIVDNNLKHSRRLETPMSVDCRIATTTALTAGTKTLDTNYLGQIGFYSNGVGSGAELGANNLYQHDSGDHALILQQNEGINIRLLTTMGAVGVGRLAVVVEFGNLASY